MTNWQQWSARFWRMRLIVLVLTVWIGANFAALAWIDVYESELLEADYHVSARVIRSYEWRTAAPSRKGGPRSVSLWYRFRPPPWSLHSRTVPLIVYLHGAGECGFDNTRQLHCLPSVLCNTSMRDRYPCAVLAPQCPRAGGWPQRLDDDTDLIDGVLRMIDDVLSDSRIDPNRVYLVGISMGAYGAWELAMRFPERFAAVLPICGGGDESRASRLVDVPIWAVHGADDEVVQVSETRDLIAAIEKAGGKPRYLELPGIGHNCWDSVFRPESEVLVWMFRQAMASKWD